MEREMAYDFMSFCDQLSNLMWERGEDVVLFDDASYLFEMFDTPEAAAEHEAFVRHSRGAMGS
jgi:hypothetical protein